MTAYEIGQLVGRIFPFAIIVIVLVVVFKSKRKNISEVDSDILDDL